MIPFIPMLVSLVYVVLTLGTATERERLNRCRVLPMCPLFMCLQG